MKENASQIGHILFHFWENCTTNTCSLGGKGWMQAVWSRQSLCQLLPLIWWALGLGSLSAATHWDSCDVRHRYLLPHNGTPVMFATDICCHTLGLLWCLPQISAATHWDSCYVCHRYLLPHTGTPVMFATDICCHTLGLLWCLPQISAATHWDSCDVCQISAATHWDSCDVCHRYLLPHTGTPVMFATDICCHTLGLLWCLPQISAATHWDSCDVYHSYHLLPDSGTPVIFTTVMRCHTVGLLWYLPQLNIERTGICYELAQNGLVYI